MLRAFKLPLPGPMCMFRRAQTFHRNFATTTIEERVLPRATLSEPGAIDEFVQDSVEEIPLDAKLMNPSFFVAQTQDTYKLTKPFLNREEEMEKLAEICLLNLSTPIIATQTTPLTLVTCNQMWGSGKSTLGYNFISQLKEKRFAPMAAKLKKNFPKHYGLLEDAVTIYVNMENMERSLDYSIALRLALFHAFMSYYKKEIAEDEKFLAVLNQLYIRHTSLAAIVDVFKTRFKATYFIIFDECDALLEASPRLDSNALVNTHDHREAVRRFYKFWSLLVPLQLAQNLIYCSGRSPFLFALGQGWYRASYGVSSGSRKCVRLLLDTLKLRDIKSMLLHYFPNANDLVIDRLARILDRRTAGVPRLIEYACEFIRKIFEKKPEFRHLFKFDTLEKVIASEPQLFGKEFRSYIHSFKPRDLDPVSQLNEKGRDQFINFIKLAALQVPVEVDLLVPADRFLMGMNVGDKVSVFEVLKMYNLHITKDVDEGEGHDEVHKEGDAKVDMKYKSGVWRLRFPSVIVDHLLEKPSIKEKYPFLAKWNEFHQLRRDNSGRTLELVAINNVALKLSEMLMKTQSSLEEVLPILKGSYVAKDSVRLSSNEDSESLSYLNFPKVTQSLRLRNFADSDAVVQYFGSLSEHFSIRPEWIALLFENNLIQKEIIYFSRPASYIGDFFIVTAEGDVVVVQIKDGIQTPTSDYHIGKEASKMVYLVPPGKKLTFVYVCLTESFRYSGDSTEIKHNGEVVAHHIKSVEHLYKELEKPKGTQEHLASPKLSKDEVRDRMNRIDVVVTTKVGALSLFPEPTHDTFILKSLSKD